jgi:Tfp pilus assembly protein PilF
MAQLKLDLELHPAAAGSWHLLALCRAATGDKKGALEAYDRALEWTPNDPAVLNDKATLLTQMGRRGQAVVLYRRALASAPNNPVFLNNLAWALVQQKRDLGEALALAKRAAALAPNNPAVWDTLGQVQQARGDHAEAVVSFHRAIRLDPQAAEVKGRMLGSLLSLKPGQVSRLSQNGAAPPPVKPALTPQPAPKPAQPKPRAAPAPASAPRAPAKAAVGWSKRPRAKPAPQTKPVPAPSPKPQAKLQAKAAPAPAPRAQPRPAVAAPDQGRPPRGWYLQLASNRNPKLAARARRRWAAKGYGAHVWAWRSSKSGLWHRLLLGPYPSKAKARYNGNLLKQAGEIKTFVLIRVP